MLMWFADQCQAQLTAGQAEQIYRENHCFKVADNCFKCDLSPAPECAVPIDIHVAVHWIPEWDQPVVVPDPEPEPLTSTEIQAAFSTANNGQLFDPIVGPSAQFAFENLTPGEYTFSVYGNGPDSSSDSVHYGLDGVFVESITLDIWAAPGPKWSSILQHGGTAKITIPDSGQHVINLWAREDGAEIIKVKMD
jgi:hypothetical protein